MSELPELNLSGDGAPPPTGKRKSDIATYMRLISYLGGMKKAVFLTFFLMFLEGVFTVVTISMMKPVLDLLMDKRVFDTSRYTETMTLEFGERKVFDDRTIAVKATGELSGSSASDELRERVRAVVVPQHSTAIIDLSNTTNLDSMAWAQLILGKFRAQQNGTAFHVVVPEGTTVPLEAANTAKFSVITTGTEVASTVQAYLAATKDPVPRKPKSRNFLSRWKHQAIQHFAPQIERVDRFAMEHKFRALGYIIVVMIVAAVVMVLCAFGVGYLSTYLGTQVVQRLRVHVFEHLLTLDMAYFNKHSPGAVLSVLLQDVAAVDAAINVLFSSVLKTPITVAMLIVFMFVVSPSLTLFSFTVLPIIGLMLYVLGRRVRRTSMRIQQSRAGLANVAQETVTGMRVVKAYNMEPYEAKRFRGGNNRIFGMALRTTAAEELGQGFTQLLGVVTVSAMVLAGGHYILNTRELGASDFVMFIGLLTQVFRPLKGTSKVNSRIQRGLAGCDRVFSVLDLEPEICDKPGAREAKQLENAIEFRNVSFGYQPERPVLRNVNLKVPAGQAIALVGETGAGKSTIVNLLPRFYDPTDGQILYDGVDLRDLKVRSLRAQIALITQDVILFDDTVANNIAYGTDEPVPIEKIVAAAKAANAHKFIEKMPDGYNSMVGSHGSRLSGGERQRLAIARAILKNAPILILDEATSSLDSETEALIQDALTNMMKGRTVFVIAHRLSTIQNCDVIYVVENGRFVEHGTHEELIARNGRYARFYSIQFGRTTSEVSAEA